MWFGSRMLFALTGPNNNPLQLWISDGSAGSTQLLWSATNVGTNNIPDLVVVGGYAHLNPVCSNCADSHLITDGRIAGTRVLQLPAPYAPVPGFLSLLGEQVFVFNCRSPSAGEDFCASDPAGIVTSVLPEVFPVNGSSGLRVLGQAGVRLLLGATDGRHGYELWQIPALADSVFANGFESSSP